MLSEEIRGSFMDKVWKFSRGVIVEIPLEGEVTVVLRG